MAHDLYRGYLLLEQQRFEDALAVFRQSLLSAPEGKAAHLGAARALFHLGRLEEAKKEAQAAILADPEDGYCHRLLGQILYELGRWEEALIVLEESLELEPEEAATYGLRTHVLCDLVRWQEALNTAEAGLGHEPECVSCLTGRARALVGLGSPVTAGDSLFAALKENPEDPWLHAGAGWAALAAKDRDKALLHFSEALRLDPELDWAREGMMEALRTKYRFYRWVFSYFAWMARLTPGQRWGVIISGYLFSRVLLAAGKSYPALIPILGIVGLVFLTFVYLSWTGRALANILLALNPNGRFLLDEDDRLEARGAGFLWGLGAVALLLQWSTSLDCWFLALLCFVQVPPLSAYFECEKGRSRQILGALNSMLVVAGAGGFLLGWLAEWPSGGLMLGLYPFLLFATVIVANILISRQR